MTRRKRLAWPTATHRPPALGFTEANTPTYRPGRTRQLAGRFILDTEPVLLRPPQALRTAVSREFEIIVVGGGIAGLTAGLSAARLGRSTLVLTGDTLGGHLLSIERVDGYPGFSEGIAGYDLCPTVQEQAAVAGAEFAMECVTALASANGAWQLETPTASYSARAIILATGTNLSALDVPGESLLRGKGVSQCASCDAPLLRDREVIVAGGGDSALQEALTLAEHCSRVTIVHHGTALAGQKAYRDLVEASSNIVLVAESEISEILGQDNVSGARVRRLNNGETTELNADAVFVFVGLQANVAIVEDSSVLDDAGRILTDGAMRTRLRGLLAAGTVRAANPGRAAASGGDGATAASAAHRYLDGGLWPDNIQDGFGEQDV